MTDASRPGSSAGSPTVFLHVGTMKSGTTFLQRVMQRNANVLAEDGVRFPLDNARWAMQVRAARDVLGIRGRPTDGAWDALVRRIHEWDGRAAAVSMEFLSLASPGRVRKIVAGLAPSPVEVVITARDLARVIPSAWQSGVKQGDTWSLPDFVAALMGDGDLIPEVHRRFWRHHDLVAIVAKWAAVVGPSHVHLVTVPPAGAEPVVLWERFSSVLGVPSDRYDVDPDRGANPALGFQDTELMRQVCLELRGEMSRAAFKRWATDYFANRVLRPGAEESPTADRTPLPAEVYDWAVRRSEEMVDELRRSGAAVVGDLADLVPPPEPAQPSGGAAPAEPYPEGTAHIIAALLRRIAEVDPQLSGHVAADEDFQRPDEAADADEAAEAATEAADDTDEEHQPYDETDAYGHDAPHDADAHDEDHAYDAYGESSTARAG